MINSNKITSTKVGDDIHYYVNGNEDRGIVVKMNNEYVTVFKESTQSYDDIHINDTFFIKDILINKEWNKMEDAERYDALKKIHAPSPRFISKPWEALPKEIKELLQKNNAIETSHKDGKDDDMNYVDTRSDWDKTKGEGGTGRKIGEDQTAGKDTGKKTESGEIITDAGDKVQGKKHKKQPIETNPETTPDKHGVGERGVATEETPDHTRITENVEDASAKFTTAGGEAQAELDRQTAGSLTTAANRQEAAFDKQQAKQEGRELQGTKETGKKVTTGMKKLKAWQLWLAKREQELLKAHELGEEDKQSDFQWHKADSSDLLRTDKPERTAEGKRSKKPANYGEGDAERVGRADNIENRPSNEYNKDRKIKAWEGWLDEQKSNPERSIHGNAAREPNSGVNTNIGFDASEDYEGFTHSGLRPEQFKHERKKPKVTTKERVNIGETYPSRAGQGTGDGGNPYNTVTHNKDDKGRARQGKDRN